MQKSELLSTIETLFWENAFSDLSMDMIAEKLGMKKASLYYHFPSKEAMFLAVLEVSFERYREFLRGVLIPSVQLPNTLLSTSPLTPLLEGEGNIDQIISSLILFPLQAKNLFAVVSQKGYCQIDEVRAFIQSKNRELEEWKVEVFQDRWGWNEARTRLFFVLIEGLSKKACLENCEGERKEEMIGEIENLFFTN